MELLEYLLILGGLLITIAAQVFVSSSYRKYKKVNTEKGLSGFEVARKILDKHGMENIYITEVKGELSDHYDPSRKVVRLSTEIFHGTSVASASVAAHEVGHAIQDKEGYGFMKLRSAIFPIVRFSSYFGYIAILLGLLFQIMDLLLIGIVLEVIILLFQLVTLPVEFDASRRAGVELVECNILTNKEKASSAKMLKAAAYTYVASVLTTLMQIARLILIYGNNRKN